MPPPMAPAIVLPAVPILEFFIAAPATFPPMAPPITWMMRLIRSWDIRTPPRPPRDPAAPGRGAAKQWDYTTAAVIRLVMSRSLSAAKFRCSAVIRIQICLIGGRGSPFGTKQSIRWLLCCPRADAEPAMQPILLLAIIVAPAVIGSIAVMNLPGPLGFCIALAASFIMMRDSLLICMLLMRHWQLFGRDLFLIEIDGRHRWVDARELKALRVPCRVRRQEFRPYLFDN